MRIPLATYRLQFNKDFDFHSCGQILDYLKNLGISDIYASPVLKAKTGSSHGYDLVDPAQINPELGGEEVFIQLAENVRSKGMGWLQDIIPNHMAYSSQNPYLMDILENAQHSKYRDYFDITWDHPIRNLNSRILAPFLGEFYGSSLDKAQIQLRYSQNGFSYLYADFDLPSRIEDYPEILAKTVPFLESKLGKDNPDYLKLLQLLREWEQLTAPAEPAQSAQSLAGLKSRLWEFYSAQGEFKAQLDGLIKEINGSAGNPGSLNELDRLLSRQNFRFAFWKVGNDELNYRRFFTVNELIGLKIEREEVFEFIHSALLRLLKENKITGLRIDHCDGLNDPLKYLSAIKSKSGDAYIVVEKILGLFEPLPAEFDCQGTTGYDFLNFSNGILIQKQNEKKIDKIYTQFIGSSPSYGEILKDKKRLFMREYMAGDIDNLARPLVNLLGKSRYGKDLTMYALKRGIVEMLAHFPVYRSYVSGNVPAFDQVHIKEAAAGAKNDNPGILYELEIIERVLLLNYGDWIPEHEREEWISFARRFQQLCCSVTAKGMEDTALYVYNRFISLNEVGGNPAVFGITARDFHDFNLRRSSHFSHTLNAGSTHDTKMGEDTHCRLNVLSEIPRDWSAFVRQAAKINRFKRKSQGSSLAPENNDEYRIYQTLIGAYPLLKNEVPGFIPRVKEYVVKAVREAKVHTNWLAPDALYEQACVNFVEEIMDPAKSQDFLNLFFPLQKKAAFYGMFNSLSQVLLKTCSPGVCDFYQGSELWDFSLVDPDNRRKVDFELRKAYLEEISAKEQSDLPKLMEELLSAKENGKIKMFLIYRLLKARALRREMFEKGSYIPLKTGGKYRKNIIAFAREFNNSKALVVCPRFFTGLVKEGENPLGSAVWLDTFVHLAGMENQAWHNEITGQEIAATSRLSAGNIFASFPAALLFSK